MGLKESICRLCNKRLYKEPVLVLQNSPRSAQGFLDEKDLVNDSAVDILIMECQGCGVIQHTLEPVEYYREVIRSIAYSSEMHQFRLTQLINWLNKYGIKGKSIIYKC